MKYRFLLVLLIFAVAMPAIADTVYLKNGRKMVGKVTETQDRVIIETKLGTMSFSRKQVDRIVKDEKTLDVPRQNEALPEKKIGDNDWEVVPDMPYHHTPFAGLEVGAKVIAYTPRKAIAIRGTVGKVTTEEESRTVKFDSPSGAVFENEDAQKYSFYKVDTGLTLAKLMFFGCKPGDSLALNFDDGKKKQVEFKQLKGENVVLREGVKLSESVPVKDIYMVVNETARLRALEGFLKAKGLSEGDAFTYTKSDGTIKMGKLVKNSEGVALESDDSNVKLDWTFIEKLEKLDIQEYKLRKLRLKASKSAYSPAVKPDDDVRAAVAAYGKADMEGEGISGRIGVKGAELLSLYVRFFSKAGIWIASRSSKIYEIETGKGFTGKVFGLAVGDPIKDALKETDIYFYRCNVNNPRRMLSETLSPTMVEILLDPKMENIEKVTVYDSAKKSDWAVVGGVIMRKTGE